MIRSRRIRPVARTGLRGPGARPLAGSPRVWFSEVIDDSGLFRPAERLDPEVLARLSARRADLCGLRLDRVRIMGILNVTPDSFSDGGDLPTPEAVVARARAMVAAGADILDIGGESTRPGATEVPVAEEIARTAPAIAAIRAAGVSVPLSIDTRKAAVAAAALDAGADIVNDVSGLAFDRAMAPLVAARGVPVVLMHHKGTPLTMQDDPRYDDVVTEVYDHLKQRLSFATAAGIAPQRVILDPGIGFGKTLQHNVSILRAMALYHDLGCPILLGASRKRFIGTIAGVDAARDRVAGSVAVALQGAAQGVQILRVHDVAETRQALSLHDVMSGADEIRVDR